MSELDNAVASVCFDLSQLDQKSWFAVVRRAMLESQEIGKRKASAELAALRDADARHAREYAAWQNR